MENNFQIGDVIKLKGEPDSPRLIVVDGGGRNVTFLYYNKVSGKIEFSTLQSIAFEKVT